MSENLNAVKPQRHTTVGEKIFYPLYFAGQNIYYIFILSFLNYFWTDYRGVSAAVVGVILLVARVWDGVNDPLFGIIVDKSNLKAGKFKPWVTIATIGLPILVILMFAMPEGLDTNMAIAYAAATYIVFGMLYTVCDVPIFALVTAMTDNISERTLMISMGRLVSTVAILAISVFAMPIVLAAGWLNAAIIFAAVGLILMIPINIAAKERFVHKNENSITIKAIFSYLVHNKMLLIFVLGNTICGATMVVTTMGNYAAKWLFGGEQMIAILNLTSMVPMLLCAILVPILNKWFGKIQLYLSGIIIMIVFGIIGYLVGYSNMTIFLALLAVRGFGYGVLVTVPFMMVADCVEYGNYKTGQRAEGITFALQTFSTKITGAVSGAIAMFVMSAIGYNGTATEQTASTISNMWTAYMTVPFIGFVVGGLILLGYKLKDKDVQIMADINQNKLTKEEGEKLLSRKY